MASVVSYADKNYQQKKALYDSVAQVFQDWKWGIVNGGDVAWNLPVQEVQGSTIRFVGEGLLEVTFHHYEMATVDDLARQNLAKEGQKFVDSIVRELKKAFKEATGKQLTTSKVDEDQVIDKTSRISAETSYMLGSSRHSARPIGRYLIRDSATFEFSSAL